MSAFELGAIVLLAAILFVLFHIHEALRAILKAVKRDRE